MISSSNQQTCKITAYLRVGSNPKGEPIHEAFANMGDTPEAFEAFTKLWPVTKNWKDFRHTIRLRFRDNLRAAWEGDERAIAMYHESALAAVIMPTKQRRIEIDLRDPLTLMDVLFLRDYWAGKTGICANKDCPNPYYIKKRKTQKYCEAGPCTGEAQRQQKLDWWNRVGKIRAKKEAKKGRKV